MLHIHDDKSGDEGGSMLLGMITSLALTMKVKTEDMAKFFASGAADRKKIEWLKAFTLESTRLHLDGITEDPKKK